MILRTTASAVLIAILAASCGGSSADAGDDAAGPNIVIQGDNALDIEEVVTTTTEAETLDAAGGAAEGGGEDGDEPTEEEAPEPEVTIPQNDDDGDEIDNLFSAMSIFNNCLKDEGREFIGVPSPEAEADDPVNDPEYLASLGKCAALSNIQEAFASLQTASENLTQDEILERNRGLVIWKDCMVGRGWTIGELEPDDKGLLSPGLPEPPEGESLLDSDDLKECTDIARAQVAEEDETA